MANHMAEVAKMLGVELGEKFECDNSQKSTYWFDSYALKCNGFPAADQLMMLLNGRTTIKRKPWKPSNGNGYWCILPNGFPHCAVWRDGWDDMNYYKLGNCYRTEEEAEANRDKWIAFYASNEVLEV